MVYIKPPVLPLQRHTKTPSIDTTTLFQSPTSHHHARISRMVRKVRDRTPVKTSTLLHHANITISSLVDSQHSRTVKMRLGKANQGRDTDIVVQVPLMLLTHRAPSLGALFDKNESLIVVPSFEVAKIFIYWVFHGKLPDVVFEADISNNSTTAPEPESNTENEAPTTAAESSKSAGESSSKNPTNTSPSPATSTTNVTPARPWIDAWLWGSICHATEFQNMVNKRLTTMTLTIEDYNYIYEKGFPSENEQIQTLETTANFALIDLLQNQEISLPDFFALIMQGEKRLSGMNLALIQYALTTQRMSSRTGKKLKATSSLRRVFLPDDLTRAAQQIAKKVLDDKELEKVASEVAKVQVASEAKEKWEAKEKGDPKGKGKAPMYEKPKEDK